MIDAHPAPTATMHTLHPLSCSDDIVNPRTDRAAAILAAARRLVPNLAAGRALDTPTLRIAMTDAFDASDSDGAWLWKDAYESRRSRRHPVPAALRPSPPATCRRRRFRKDARHAGSTCHPGALAFPPLRGPGPPAAVLHAAPARLGGRPGRRHPARRYRPRTLRRHRHARGHGLDDSGPQRPTAPQRDRRHAGRPSASTLSRFPRQHRQCRDHCRPAARAPAHRRHHEPSLLHYPLRLDDQPPCRPPPCPVRLLHAAFGRPTRSHNLRPLHPWRPCLAQGLRQRPSACPHPLHRRHRRPRLRAARHELRYPPHRTRAQRQTFASDQPHDPRPFRFGTP